MATRATNIGTASRPEQSEYASPRDIPEQYQVILDVRGDQTLHSDGSNDKVFPIVAALPEHYNVSLSSEWESPYANGSAVDFAAQLAGNATYKGIKVQDIISKGSELLGQATGVSTRLKGQSLKVWNGSSGVRFSLDLTFHAKKDTIRDIRDKHMALLKLCAPSEHGPGGQILMQPGPIIANQVWDEKSRKISLQLGTYMYFDNVVIHSVGSDVETLCDKNGIPIAMTINIEVETFYSSFTVQDIDKAFKGKA
jgi:hypothetical protein